MTQAIWTLDELTDRVGAALSVGYDGQPSGRVRHLPDRRAIRCYPTTGGGDGPAAPGGRTAMYGPRHLLQLVAIKRLQAQGLSLVAIQAELAGATDTQLARVAQVPQAAAPDAPPAPAPRRPTAALHGTPAIARPSAALASGQGEAPAAAPTGGPALASGRRLARQARFWRERPAEATDTEAAATAGAEAAGTGAAGVATLHGVRLGERATLLLDPARPLDDADLRAILDAARPLLQALRARGLDHPGRELP
jgi:DNA-binding transcriptional MerR regulator